MNSLTKTLVIITTCLFLSSCGYQSYDECVKEEIKLNNGKVNSYIKNYCSEEFPSPTRDNEYYLKESEVEITWTGDKYKIKNYSDYSIDILKVAFTSKKCSNWNLGSIDWASKKNYLPGSNYIAPGATFTITGAKGYSCATYRAIVKY